MDSSLPKLAHALPTLARELRESLVREGETNLAAQVDHAIVHALCACDEQGCLGVYLSADDAPCVGHYRAVLPDAVVSVGVCCERLNWIDDNELISPAGPKSERRREFDALRPQVPGRLP